MELRHVKAFVAVADARHFGRAAAALHLTQPGLTQRIQTLERELGVQLLVRDSREVTLTPAGEAFLAHARHLTQEEDRAVRMVRDHVEGIAGRLRISYLGVWNVGLPAQIVSEFRRLYPSIRLETTSAQSRLNMQGVANDDLDLAFVAVPSSREGVVVRPIYRQEILLVMNPTHHLARMVRVPIDRLKGEPIIAVSSASRSPHVDAARKWLAKCLGEEPNIVAEEPPDQVPAAVAQAGVAVAFTTEMRVPAMLAAGLVCRPLSPGPLVEYGVAYLDRKPSMALAHMLQIIDQFVPEFSSFVPPGYELVWRAQELEHIPAVNSPR